MMAKNTFFFLKSIFSHHNQHWYILLKTKIRTRIIITDDTINPKTFITAVNIKE